VNRKSAGTTLAPAAAAENTKNAAGRIERA